MKIRTKDFFSNEEREKIRQAVADGEKNTSGEIVVALVDASDRYREADLLGSLLVSAIVALVLSISLAYLTIWFYIPVTALLYFPAFYCLKLFPHMKLALVGHTRIHDAVKEKAIYTFFQRGVHKTKEQTGILIFISLLERKVWILADEGIHGKIRSNFWRALTRELTQGIKDGRPLEALQDVIGKCGAELAHHYPGRKDDQNELGDDVIC